MVVMFILRNMDAGMGVTRIFVFNILFYMNLIYELYFVGYNTKVTVT